MLYFVVFLQFLTVGTNMVAIWGVDSRLYLAIDEDGTVFTTVSIYNVAQTYIVVMIMAHALKGLQISFSYNLGVFCNVGYI